MKCQLKRVPSRCYSCVVSLLWEMQRTLAPCFLRNTILAAACLATTGVFAHPFQPISTSVFALLAITGGAVKNVTSLSRWLVDNLDLDKARKQKLALTGKFIWGIVNNIPLLHNAVLRYLYITGTNLIGTQNQILHYRHNYDLLGSFQNTSYFARGLPPVPLECPTPLGVKGEVLTKLSRDTYAREFKPCPFRTNLMFATFAQYLSYQFFNVNFPDDLYFGRNESDEVSRRALRSWVNGKLKARVINGEEYPPYLEDVPGIEMFYPKADRRNVFPKWAMNHKMFSITPFMFGMATIWLREHNRVCDILGKTHPHWNDERLYQTARWIVLGELLTITTAEYFQHLAQYRFKLGYKPHLIHNKMIPPSNEMQYEFNLAFQWHQLLPDTMQIQKKTYNLSNLLFSNNRIVFEHGLDAIVDFMSRTSVGQITYQNCGKTFMDVMKQQMEEGRRTRLHSFNDYRKYFGLKPYESFKELTGDAEMAQILENLYGDVDAVEFVIGCFLEKNSGSVAPPTMIFLVGPVALREILSNPIGSPTLWRPSTFGGKVGFDIVQKATLKKLFCLNLKGNCKNNVWVSFKTPARVAT
ncbi:hypothetical protein RUM43_010982 [Polyplax serrata]|uniref:Prostaglandin-endoperoxide synthase n=1 Tax=Polyplax serrata TaxID=468196 RepID=A0AAN8S0N0_POLSC